MWNTVERAQIRAKTLVDDRTIRRYPAVSAASRLRIEQAARELGLELPQVEPKQEG